MSLITRWQNAVVKENKRDCLSPFVGHFEPFEVNNMLISLDILFTVLSCLKKGELRVNQECHW